MSLVSLYTDFKQIYGFCPCCGALFRLSDVTLFTKSRPPKTPFDELEDEWGKLSRSQERFDSQEKMIRAKARERGQKAARARLRAIAPFFVRRRIDPNDVKVLFDPVDYVVFRGLNAGFCDAVALIDRQKTSARDRRIQDSLASAVRSGNVEWLTLTVSDTGEVNDQKARA